MVMSDCVVEVSILSEMLISVKNKDGYSLFKTFKLFKDNNVLNNEDYVFDYCKGCLINKYKSIMARDVNCFKELLDCFNRNDYLAKKLVMKLKEIYLFKYKDYKLNINLLKEHYKIFLEDEFNCWKDEIDLTINFIKDVVS